MEKKNQNLSTVLGTLVLVACVSAAGFWINRLQDDTITATEPAVTLTEEVETVAVTINDSVQENYYTTAYLDGMSAFEALQTIVQREGMEVDYEQYDFGVMINGIGDTLADDTTSSYWLYYVNDQSPTVGADSYLLEADDKVEFRYERLDF